MGFDGVSFADAENSKGWKTGKRESAKSLAAQLRGIPRYLRGKGTTPLKKLHNSLALDVR